MPLIGFTVFKEKILDGTKTQTTRKFRKHPIKVGDKLYLYWHTRQKDCKKLGEAICTEVMTIQMHSEYWAGRQHALLFRWVARMFAGTECTPWERISNEETLEIAKRDGFQDDVEMADWFLKHHGLPGVFQVIRWQTTEYTPEDFNRDTKAKAP